jgi:phage-related protein
MIKPLFWMGSSYDDLMEFPEPVRRRIGYLLHVAQAGGKPPSTKPLRGFGGAGVLEALEDFEGSTFRAVYTVRFPTVVYVLHVFQKKSKRGIATPRRELDRIRIRLQLAMNAYAEHSNGKETDFKSS